MHEPVKILTSGNEDWWIARIWERGDTQPVLHIKNSPTKDVSQITKFHGQFKGNI
jgi:hypothetical protein